MFNVTGLQNEISSLPLSGLMLEYIDSDIKELCGINDSSIKLLQYIFDSESATIIFSMKHPRGMGETTILYDMRLLDYYGDDFKLIRQITTDTIPIDIKNDMSVFNNESYLLKLGYKANNVRRADTIYISKYMDSKLFTIKNTITYQKLK